MYCQVMSASLHGLNAIPVAVETDISEGMPMMDMVGYLSSEVKEARERVRSAFKNSGYAIPAKRITINLFPAGVRKQGTGFDLPIALSLLSCLGTINRGTLEGIFSVGELCLDGRVAPVNGILPFVLMAKESGASVCMVSCENQAEAGLVEGIAVIGVRCLKDAVEYLNGRLKITSVKTDIKALLKNAGQSDDGADFQKLQGQPGLRRGLEISAAGLHNVIMQGVPGAGKTMSASCLPTILPPLDVEESLELSSIYSICGRLPQSGVISKRPFVCPHHTCTPKMLTGGGANPKPGALTLAHRGVLFLDELPEFSRESLEVMRQPLEEHKVRLVRIGFSCVYPADFLLAAAMNPCRCGYYPNRDRCNCQEVDVQKYRSKISGPLWDRIDLCVNVEPVMAEELIRPKRMESSAAIRERVIEARARQLHRQGVLNGRMDGDMIAKFCALGASEEKMMKDAFLRMNLSARGYHKLLKVARTLADMDGVDCIRDIHLAEAIGLRSV